MKAAQRKKIPTSEFALPSKARTPAQKAQSGNYPVDTPARARNALARVSQHGTSAEQAAVRRKVKAKYPSIDVGGKKGAKK